MKRADADGYVYERRAAVVNRIKKIFGRFDRLPLKRKMHLVTAVTLTVCMLITIPSYAWFNEQKKAAEMFKVEYPNALYVNAAHREDRIFFDLGPINVNANEKDKFGNDIYYSKADGQPNYIRVNDVIQTDENGAYLYITDPTQSETHKISKMQYVFSVSGSGTNSFKLQLAHTTNNQFIYTVYDATQYQYKKGATGLTAEQQEAQVPAGTNDDRIVEYKVNENSHTENKLIVPSDPSDEPAFPSTLYYVRSASSIGMTSENKKEVDLPGVTYKKIIGKTLSDSATEKYYTKTYEQYTDVNEYAVPIYWQKTVTLHDSEIDENQKTFCKYYILEVTWNDAQQATMTNKETDMVYISVGRGNG